MNLGEKSTLLAAFITALAIHGVVAAFHLPAPFSPDMYRSCGPYPLQVTITLSNPPAETLHRDTSAENLSPHATFSEPVVPDPLVKSAATVENSFPSRSEQVDQPEKQVERKALSSRESPVSQARAPDGETEKDVEKQRTDAVPSTTTTLDEAEKVSVNRPTDDAADREQADEEVAPAVPRYRENPPPRYPASAARRGQEGLVLLSVTVGIDGRPKEVSVKKSSGYEILDESALRAVKDWRFDPATRRGVPFEMTVEIPVRFELSQGNW